MSNVDRIPRMINPELWPLIFPMEWEEGADFRVMEEELESAALANVDYCVMLLRNDVESQAGQLPVTREFARCYNQRKFNDRTYDFSFVARSLVPQPPMAELHIDANAGTGIGDDQPATRSWRLLFNFSAEHPRDIIFSTENPARMQKTRLGGYIACSGFDRDMLATISLDPRDGRWVSGVLLCVSEVAHSGADGPYGRFTGSYGYEETVL